jgi:putative hydrolase of the HAD superfamily
MNIVFDFGNVLVEWNPAKLIQFHYAAKDGRAHFPDALADTLINHQDWLDFDLGAIDASELAVRSARRLGLDAAGLLAFIERIPHVLPVHDSVVALAQELADGQHGEHRVLYLSNMPVEFAEVLEARCPWIARFESGIFSAAENELRLNPSDTLFLDDSPRNVHAARARGWRAEIIDSPQHVQQALAMHRVLRLP